MRPSVRLLASILIVAVVTQAGVAQTRPADDNRAVVIEAARAYIRAARALDQAALLKLFAPTDDAAKTRAIHDRVWVSVEVQRLRSAAETKLGPEPEPGVESEEWGWGILPERYFDFAVKNEPTIIDIKEDQATVWAFGLPPLKKLADGRWLFVLEDDAGGMPGPADPKLKAAMEERFKSILSDIESGKIQSAGDIPRMIISLVGG